MSGRDAANGLPSPRAPGKLAIGTRCGPSHSRSAVLQCARGSRSRPERTPKWISLAACPNRSADTRVGDGIERRHERLAHSVLNDRPATTPEPLPGLRLVNGAPSKSLPNVIDPPDRLTALPALISDCLRAAMQHQHGDLLGGLPVSRRQRVAEHGFSPSPAMFLTDPRIAQ